MKKISMVIVAISAMISLSGCHEDPTYVDSYFQRQSVIEELSNELKGHSDSKVPVTLNYGGKQHLVCFSTLNVLRNLFLMQTSVLSLQEGSNWNSNLLLLTM